MTAKQILTKAGLQATFWGRRIIAAEKRGKFTADDVGRSEGWVTCACGRLNKRIPRNHFDQPIDSALYWMGLRFRLDSVTDDASRQARILVDIDRRAGQIIRAQAKAARKA